MKVSWRIAVVSLYYWLGWCWGFFDEELHTVFSYGANCDHSYCMECGFFIRSTHRRCDECDAMRTQAKAISLVMHEWYSADVVQ